MPVTPYLANAPSKTFVPSSLKYWDVSKDWQRGCRSSGSITNTFPGWHGPCVPVLVIAILKLYKTTVGHNRLESYLVT